MKKIITPLIIILSLVFMCSTVNAASGTFYLSGGNLKWKIDSNGTFTITGNNAIKGYFYPARFPWHGYRTRIKSIVIGSGITKIGDKSFYSCKNAKSVTIPNTVTYIGESAFYLCSNLQTIYYEGTLDEWNNITIKSKNHHLSDATLYTKDSIHPIQINDTQYPTIENALNNALPGDTIEVILPLDNTDKTITLPDNITLDVKELRNLRNTYINIPNNTAAIKMGDVTIKGQQLYFNDIGKLNVVAGYSVKLIKPLTEYENQQGFIWSVLTQNITAESHVIFTITDTSDSATYNNKKYKYEFGNIDIAGESTVQMGLIFNNVPKEIQIEITEVN